MIIVYSPHHILHNPPREFVSNQVAAYGESPERAELIFEALLDIPEAKRIKVEPFDLGYFYKIHARDYLDYLQSAYEEWVAEGLWHEGIMPEFFAIGSMRDKPPVNSPLGKAGYYMTDSCSMIVKGTWEAVKYSGFTALTGARCLADGVSSVFSICRPPGHHAGYDYSGGYCFVNNAALAARFLQENGVVKDRKGKVAILDIDFHHGNGTQDIIGRQENIFFVSIHGDPSYAYPYLRGYESENSAMNINFPLPTGIDDEYYYHVFGKAVGIIREFNPAFLVVSLGVDTFEKDSLGNFRLTTGIYRKLAEYLITELKIPVQVIMEGGYNAEYLSTNVLSFLSAFFDRGL